MQVGWSTGRPEMGGDGDHRVKAREGGAGGWIVRDRARN